MKKTSITMLGLLGVSSVLQQGIYAADNAPTPASAQDRYNDALSKAESLVSTAKTKALARQKILAQADDVPLMPGDIILRLFYARHSEENWTDEEWQTQLRKAAFVAYSAGSSSGAAPATGTTPSISSTTAPSRPISTRSELSSMKSAEGGPEIKVDAGYSFKFGSNRKSEPYYRVQVRGKELTKRGTEPTAMNVTGQPETLDTSAPSSNQSTGDTSDYSLRFENNSLNSSGSLFDIIGVRDKLFGAENGFLKNLRGVAQLNGNSQTDQYNLALGLEAPPIHPLKLLGLNKRRAYTNYLIPGIVGEKQVRAGSGENKNSIVGTYRGFIGLGRHWVPDEDLKALIADTIELAPNYARAVEIAAAPPAGNIATGAEDRVRGFLAYYQGGPLSDPEWEKAISNYVEINSESHRHPTQAFWLESAGWYRAQDGIGPNFGNLTAATATYWLNPSEGGTKWLRLRYEAGRDRAAPTERKNMIALSLGMEF
jgi:hypothetical protein